MTAVNVRELIADSLLEMEKNGTFLSAMEQAVLDKYDYMDTRDKAFYKRVLSGTIERKIRIDYILGLFSTTKINKMKPFVRAVLRSSVYQLMWMDMVPDSAVCNEAVKLISKRGLSGLRGFVNGVLRNICRNKDNIKYPDKNKDKLSYLSIYYSCPEWIVSKLMEQMDDKTTEAMLEATMNPRPVSVRIRNLDEEKALCDIWKKDGIKIEAYPDIKGAYKLRGLDGVNALGGYDEGAFAVQDYGSMMVALSAGIKSGDTIMDLCAAPGGKSLHAADILNSIGGECGHVYSYDLTEEKCDRIRENAERLKVSNITVSQHDATEFIPDMEEKADIVIVDAPCSGIGVIGHKSDIKYRLLPEDISALATIQKSILDVAVRYVKPGGKLVYSTCTLTAEENQKQKEYIIDNYPFSIVNRTDGEEDLMLIPGKDDSDGFYVAVFMKEEKNG